MSLALKADAEPATVGRRMHALMAELYPICRSITGDGLRRTLAELGKGLPMEIHEVPTGTPVLDWTVPKEWNIRDGYIRDPKGRKVVDFQDSNLHVVNYSVPVHRHLSLAELKDHVFTLPDQPTLVPYRTSYYEETWGFCMAHETLEGLGDGEYEVCIDATLGEGSLTYGELVLPGESAEEVLISCHCCHPSLCNDNLSGMAVATFLARELHNRRRKLTYRFLFIPGTIGSITWLARNEDQVERIRHGLVLTCLGDGGPFHYKRSRRGDAEIDRVMEHVLTRAQERGNAVEDFIPYGYDERQYCSPGFDLPVGGLSRTPHGRFPEYHTSADDLDFVRPEHLERSLETCLQAVSILEGNRAFRNTHPKGEPQLGRRGLMGGSGGARTKPEWHMSLLWTLNLSDGTHDLLSIADRSDIGFEVIQAAATELERHGLLAPVEEES
jgi:aminopeptidase-like protein